MIEITSAWVLVEAGVNIYLCFCQKMLSRGTLTGRHLQHLLFRVLPAGAHGDGAGGKLEWKWLHFQPSSAGDWMCVSAGPWEGKFAHTSSRAAAELNVVIKRLLTEVGQPAPTAWSDHGASLSYGDR